MKIRRFLSNDSAAPKLVQRWDTIALGGQNFERTPQGGIRVRARVSRSGILEYDLPDGTKRREWCPPEELFRPESYSTLHDAPITVHHPDGGEVQSGTYQRVTVGHCSTDIAPEQNEYLAGTAVIQDESTVRMALGGSLTELSAGYLSALEMTPGVVPEGYPDAGQPYDCIQRNRKYNHVALLPPGMGRAGPEVSLRLDSKGNQIGPTTKKEDQMELTPEELSALKALAQVAPALQALVAAPSPEAPAPAPAAPAPTTDNTPAAAPAAPEQPKQDETPPEEKKTDGKGETKPEAKKEEAPKGLSAEEQERIVNDSIELRDQARKVLGSEYAFTGKSNRQVMTDVIKHVDSKYSTDKKSDEALRAVFDMAVPRYLSEQAAKTEQHGLLRTVHTDSDDPDFVDDDAWLKKQIAS